MAGPYKCKRMRVKVTEATHGVEVCLGVVEGMDIELIREGGVVPHYDSETPKHAVGTRHATFRLRRWFKTDYQHTDLLFDLFDNETQFWLSGELSNISGSTIMLSGCLIYSYRPVTGGANDIVSEEARGECVDWVAGTIKEYE